MKKIVKEIKLTAKGKEDPSIFPDDENASTLISLFSDIYGEENILVEKIETEGIEDGK